MPKFNGTGPAGYGPGTGRGLGPCACPPSPGRLKAFGRRGGGMAYGRRGGGRGLGMKIAVSSIDENIESNVSAVFGRCHYFIIAEIENQEIKKFEAIKNESENQMGGAGISTAQLMAEKNVSAVITGNMGPRALDVLKQFNIEVYAGSGVIKEVLQEFLDGKLKKIER